MKFYENPSNRSRGVFFFLRAGGQRDGRIDKTKLTVAFRNFANALKTPTFCSREHFMRFLCTSQETPIISVRSKKKTSTFYNRKKCVYCAVRTYSVNIIQVIARF